MYDNNKPEGLMAEVIDLMKKIGQADIQAAVGEKDHEKEFLEETPSLFDMQIDQADRAIGAWMRVVYFKDSMERDVQGFHEEEQPTLYAAARLVTFWDHAKEVSEGVLPRVVEEAFIERCIEMYALSLARITDGKVTRESARRQGRL